MVSGREILLSSACGGFLHISFVTIQCTSFVVASKIIDINGQPFPCRLDASVEIAEARIRSGFVVEGGWLEDENGALMDRNSIIKDTVGQVKFVGGRSVSIGKIFH